MNKLGRLTMIAAIAAGSLAVPAASQAQVAFSINVGPPPPRYEVVPPPRPGYVWAPGYWNWNGHQHVWHNGYWQHERHGYRWAPTHWERHGNNWRMNNGHWVRAS